MAEIRVKGGNTMKLTCKACKHSWTYGGKSEFYATCPRCLSKVRVAKYKKVRYLMDLVK